jgi:hypothetical protein
VEEEERRRRRRRGEGGDAGFSLSFVLSSFEVGVLLLLEKVQWCFHNVLIK